VRKAARFVSADRFLLLKRLSVPSAWKFLDDPRCFAAMQVKRGVEVTVLADRSKSLVRTDMLGQLAAQEIAERAAGQPGKEVASEDAEPVRRS
jgi:hypothetical protein